MSSMKSANTMPIKKTALFFLTLASAILLLHNIIPHSHEHLADVPHSHFHHHDAITPGESHHHHENDPVENNENNEKDLADYLSIISHQSDGITFVNGHHFNIGVSKQLFSNAFIISEQFSFSEFQLPPLIHYQPVDFFECNSFHPCTNALRGPPSIAV